MTPTIEGSSGIRKASASDARRRPKPTPPTIAMTRPGQDATTRRRSASAEPARADRVERRTRHDAGDRPSPASDRPPPEPDRGQRSPATTRRRSRTSRSAASIHAPIAIARRDARQPERPDEDDRQGRVDDDGEDRRRDRRARVLAGVEGAGQDGDQRVRRRARAGTRSSVAAVSVDRRPVELAVAEQQRRRLGAQDDRRAPAIGSITNDEQPQRARSAGRRTPTRPPDAELARQRREERRCRAGRRSRRAGSGAA